MLFQSFIVQPTQKPDVLTVVSVWLIALSIQTLLSPSLVTDLRETERAVKVLCTISI